ncbi:hypothetical protein LBYZC6_51700 [Lacrimispora brassicae]
MIMTIAIVIDSQIVNIKRRASGIRGPLSKELFPSEDPFPCQLEGEALSHYKPPETSYEDFPWCMG